MTTFSVLEHGVLKHGVAEGQIPPHLAARLAAAARAVGPAPNGAEGVFGDRRSELRARGVVGALFADDCVLEILPKIDVPAPEGSAEARGAILRRLAHMLAVALDLKLGIGRLWDFPPLNERWRRIRGSAAGSPTSGSSPY
jgi:5-methylcytosine-specific restriction enzyme subunit McrC